MRLIVPAGIGDWSWIWSKIYGVRDEITSVRIVDGAPRRTKEYVEACGVSDVDYDVDKRDGHGNVVEHSITGGSYERILSFEGPLGLSWEARPSWKTVKNLKMQTVCIEANKHLEAGCRLERWLWDLPTYFHYPLYVSEEDRKKAREVTIGAIQGDRFSPPHPMKEGPVVGISCASYKGSAAWLTWGREEWVDFLRRLMSIGWRPLLLGGQWDDLTYTVACELNLPCTIGKTSVAQMIEQMRILDSYIGFSSGMNVIRTVVDKPAMALWPCNEKCDQQELSTSWAPPHMLASERYVAVTWRPVRDIWPVAKRFLRRCEVELADRHRESDLKETPTLSSLLGEGYNGGGALQ